MNIGQTKHYSLLLQDDGDTHLYEGLSPQHVNTAHDETVMDADFQTIIEEDEEEEVDDEENGEFEAAETCDEVQETRLEVPVEEAGVGEAGEDSEEEIYRGSRHRTLAHDGLKRNGRHHNEYQLLNNGDTDSGTSTKGSSSSIDQPKLATVWTPTPMSPARRACVLASVMLGVLVTVVFVWVMPCGVDDLCGVSKDEGVKIGLGQEAQQFRDAWMQVLDGIGSNATLSLFSGSRGQQDVLVSYYAPPNITSAEQLWAALAETAECREHESVIEDQPPSPECGYSSRSRGYTSPLLHCGLMLLKGSTGETVWREQLSECPALTMCHLMDESRNSVSSCLVVGVKSLVLLFDPHTGHVLWQINGQTNSTRSLSGREDISTLQNPGKPILLPDVTGDSHPDLLFPGLYQKSYTDSNINSIGREKQEAIFDTITLPNDKYLTDDDAASQTSDGIRFEDADKDVMVNEMILISGSTGKVVGKPFQIKQCHRLTDIANDGESIDYSCVMNSGNKLAGKIPLVSLIHQIMGPYSLADNETDNMGYPSIVPFVPTPDIITNRYCQVEVTNRGNCPLCDAKVKLLSTSEVENLWQVEYDASVVLDWEPLVSEGKCYGLLLKVIAWDEITDLQSTQMESSPLLAHSQRTTRSSFGNDDEEEDAEEGFSAAGENFEAAAITDKLVKTAVQLRYLQGSGVITRDRVSNFLDNSPKKFYASAFYNPPVSHVRHSRMRNEINSHPFLRTTSKISVSPKEQSKGNAFEHPTIHFHDGKQTSVSEENKFEPRTKKNMMPLQKRSRIPKKAKKSWNLKEKVYRETERLHSKNLDATRNSNDLGYRHSSLDFELPINIFGLPLDSQPPEGFSLQRLTEFIMLVQFNGSSWTDITLKKVPIFQLCKDSTCIPSEQYSSKLVVDRLWGEAAYWSVMHAVTTLTHGPETPVTAEGQNDRATSSKEADESSDDSAAAARHTWTKESKVVEITDLLTPPPPKINGEKPTVSKLDEIKLCNA